MKAILPRLIKNSRPTTRGAFVELFLVLAGVIVIIGVYRGWFSDSVESRTKDNEPAQRTVEGDASNNPHGFRGLCQVVRDLR